MSTFEPICSGLPGLDLALDHIRLGDNVVWQVTQIEDYLFFVLPYLAQAKEDGRHIVYMHFSGSTRLLDDDCEIPVYTFDPSDGFETFTMDVRQRIADEGRDAFYIFDCLSELQTAWTTDMMMGNFFQVTCPYLFSLNAVAYFPVLRGRHSFDAIARIQETTQLLLDVYRDEEHLYINPIKVWNRYAPDMFLPHLYDPENGSFLSARSGYEIAQFYTLVDTLAKSEENQNLDSWDRFVAEAQLIWQKRHLFPERTRKMLASNMMSCDEKILELLAQYFKPDDYFQVYHRIIGTGNIGGKACGMLLARKIIEANDPDANARMAPHDSWYLGSDVFYAYIVHNKFWRMYIEQKREDGYFRLAKKLEERFANGEFPETIQRKFARMLDYFGQHPIIVRSSSLQEDGFGNAFAGKYESVFCINSGTRSERLEELEQAVRTVYASTMNRSALEYRLSRGLDFKDEQMAILIQRVSGTMYEDFLMPNAAGVGYSYSLYCWNNTMDPKDGMLRLVMGLGTRAVDRTEGDYPRIVNLSAPTSSTMTGSREKHQHSQRYVDLMDYQTRSLATRPLSGVAPYMPDWYKRMVLEHDYAAERMFRERGERREILFASCEGLAKNREFTDCMKSVLRTLQDAYHYPVDIEFTVSGNPDGNFFFNLLQCRPLQTGARHENVTVPELIPERTIFSVRNSSMGGSANERLDYVVWVDPKGYSECPYKKKPDIARVIGEISHAFRERKEHLILFVPGRIGTSSPELGVPVSFAEIHNFCAICEMTDRSIGYVPELSYGSHMFQDLVEAEIFYTAIFDDEQTEYFNRGYFAAEPNLIGKFAGSYEEYFDIVKVYDVKDRDLYLYSDMKNERTWMGCIPQA